MSWRGFLTGTGVAVSWIVAAFVLVEYGLLHDRGTWPPVIGGLALGVLVCLALSARRVETAQGKDRSRA